MPGMPSAWELEQDHVRGVSTFRQFVATSFVVGVSVALVAATHGNPALVVAPLVVTLLVVGMRALTDRPPDTWLFTATTAFVSTQTSIAVATSDAVTIWGSLISFSLLFLQSLIYRQQVRVTIQHFKEVLDCKIGDRMELHDGRRIQIVENYSQLAFAVIDVDYFPEAGFNRLFPDFSKAVDRQRFVRMLPPDTFDKIEPWELIVPSRAALWRAFFATTTITLWIVSYCAQFADKVTFPWDT